MEEKNRPVGDMEGTIVSVDHIHAGRCDLVLSRLIVDQEVRAHRMPLERQVLFERALKRPNVTYVDFEPPINALMTEIFDYYSRYPDGVRKMALPDAMHLATAINKNVEAFYTFDGGRKGGMNLLKLDGDVAGHKLHICKPPYDQAPLPFRF